MRGSSGQRFESLSRARKRSKEGKTKRMNTTETREAKRSNREGILAVVEEDLVERPHSKVFVDVSGECVPYHKEIGELSQAEMKTLEPSLRIRVVNRLLERYLAEQGHLNILEGRRPYQGHTGHRPREPSLCGSGLQWYRRRLIHCFLTPL
jgi:hypothetical protein